MNSVKTEAEFFSLPEPDSLHAKYRGTLIWIKLLLHLKDPVSPEPRLITGCLYRVTIQIDSNLLLTSKQKLRFSTWARH